MQSSQTGKRCMEIVGLTDDELAAVQDDYDKLEEAIKKNTTSSSSDSPT